MYPSVYPADLASLIIPFIVLLWFTTVWSYQSSLLNPWGRRIPWRRKWQPTPVFLPGKFHGWRSSVDYSPWGCKESDMTELAHRQPSLYSFCHPLFHFNAVYLLYSEYSVSGWLIVAAMRTDFSDIQPEGRSDKDSATIL